MSTTRRSRYRAPEASCIPRSSVWATAKSMIDYIKFKVNLFFQKIGKPIALKIFIRVGGWQLGKRGGGGGGKILLKFKYFVRKNIYMLYIIRRLNFTCGNTCWIAANNGDRLTSWKLSTLQLYAAESCDPGMTKSPKRLWPISWRVRPIQFSVRGRSSRHSDAGKVRQKFCGGGLPF